MNYNLLINNSLFNDKLTKEIVNENTCITLENKEYKFGVINFLGKGTYFNVFLLETIKFNNSINNKRKYVLKIFKTDEEHYFNEYIVNNLFIYKTTKKLTGINKTYKRRILKSSCILHNGLINEKYYYVISEYLGSTIDKNRDIISTFLKNKKYNLIKKLVNDIKNQLLIFRKLGILHNDLKYDNILVDIKKNKINFNIIDFSNICCYTELKKDICMLSTCIIISPESLLYNIRNYDRLYIADSFGLLDIIYKIIFINTDINYYYSYKLAIELPNLPEFLLFDKSIKTLNINDNKWRLISIKNIFSILFYNIYNFIYIQYIYPNKMTNIISIYKDKIENCKLINEYINYIQDKLKYYSIKSLLLKILNIYKTINNIWTYDEMYNTLINENNWNIQEYNKLLNVIYCSSIFLPELRSINIPN